MIHTAFPTPGTINRREILRYAGVREETPELADLLEEALAELLPTLTGKVCWQEFPLKREEDVLDLGFTRIRSDALARNLAGCDRIILFAATLGLGPDRLIARYGRLSPAKALLLQAIGTERIEDLCDRFCETLRQEAQSRGLSMAPRFSPGYGDFPLTVQRDLFRVLDCSRKIGLTLNESFLMSPSKSVTAIVGLGPCANAGQQAGCSGCGKTDCPYRRTP